jgi:hypothetical protein
LTIIVHTVEQAIDALEVAAELNIPVTLQSAPEAIFYAGSLYLLHMFAFAHNACPSAKARFVIDAADSEAEAIAALQMGHKHLRSSAPEEVRTRLADIASQCGAEFITGDFQALDMENINNPKASCRTWLLQTA